MFQQSRIGFMFCFFRSITYNTKYMVCVCVCVWVCVCGCVGVVYVAQDIAGCMADQVTMTFYHPHDNPSWLTFIDHRGH